MTQTPSLINLLSPNNIIIYILIFTRLTGLMQSAPFISTIKAPAMIKVWFSATIAFIIYPIIYMNKNFIIPKDMAELIILLAIEFFVGYLIGFVANLLFEGVKMTGNILSIQTGLSMSEALDPATGVTSNELSRIYVYLVTLIFITTGAHQMLFMALFNSFQAIPMGVFPVFDPQFVLTMVHLFGQIFKIAFGVALPIFSVLLISDMLLGIMSKTMPQMNIYMVALPVKIYIGLFLILAFLSVTGVYLENLIQNYIHAINLIFT